MTRDLDVIYDIKFLYQYNKKVILYGASSTGIHVAKELKSLGISICYFCDKKPKINEVLGIKVIKPNKLFEIIKDEDYLIIITSVYINEIMEELSKFSCANLNIITYLGFLDSVDCNINNKIIPEEYKKKYEAFSCWNHIIQEKAYQQITRELDFRNIEAIYEADDPVLVYQPGKVGSSSIYKSIKKIGLDVIHLHRLGYNETFLGKEIKDSYIHILNEIRNKKRIRIITGVREPIARDISSFMHNWGDGRWRTYQLCNRDLNVSFHNVVDSYYIKKGPTNAGKWIDICWNKGVFGQMFEWFDYEIKNIFGIDIFDYTFDNSKGYSIIKKDNIEIFIYKLEYLNQMEEEIADFLELDRFELFNDNVAESKKYKYLYKEFKHNLKLKKQYVDFYYQNNSRMDYFYSEKEKKELKKKWEKSIIN